MFSEAQILTEAVSLATQQTPVQSEGGSYANLRGLDNSAEWLRLFAVLPS